MDAGIVEQLTTMNNERRILKMNICVRHLVLVLYCKI